MRYYYAVVECDSVDTARKVYKECDGLEFETSRNLLDVRYIPDDVTFDEHPKEVCDRMPGEGEFDPEKWETKALTQVGRAVARCAGASHW